MLISHLDLIQKLLIYVVKKKGYMQIIVKLEHTNIITIYDALHNMRYAAHFTMHMTHHQVNCKGGRQ